MTIFSHRFQCPIKINSYWSKIYLSLHCVFGELTLVTRNLWLTMIKIAFYRNYCVWRCRVWWELVQIRVTYFSVLLRAYRTVLCNQNVPFVATEPLLWSQLIEICYKSCNTNQLLKKVSLATCGEWRQGWITILP